MPEIFFVSNPSFIRLTSIGLLILRVVLALILVVVVKYFDPKNSKENFTPFPKNTLAPISVSLLGFFSWMFVTKLTQHLALHTHSHDVSIFHTALWNTIHGNFMVDTLRNQVFFSDHLIFLLILFIPFYLVFSGPETLFFLSALAFALGGFFLGKLAFCRTRNVLIAVLFSLAFFLNRYVWGAFLHEFHPDFFAPAFFFLLFLSIYNNWNIRFWLSVVLILTTKEDYALYLIPIGAYFLFQKKWHGLPILLSGIGYSILAFKWLIPYFYNVAGKESSYTYLGSWSQFGSGFSEIMITILRNPVILIKYINFESITDFFSKFLFLPLLAPFSLIYLLPPLILNSASQLPIIRNLSIHYGLIPAVFAFAAAVESLRWLYSKWPSKAHWIVALLVMIAMPRFSFFIPQPEAKMISRFSSVGRPTCVQSSVYPHLPVNSNMSVFPECSEDAAQLILSSNAEPYPFQKWEFDERLEEILKGNEWKLVKKEAGLLLFEKAK